MKCTNTKMDAKRKPRNKKRGGIGKARLALAGMGVAVLLLAVVLGVLLFRKNSTPDLPAAYSREAWLYGDGGTSAQVQRAKLFSEELCVSSDGISAEGVSIGESEAAALFDIDGGNVLFARNMYRKMYPASITKIMTAILACKYGNMSDTVTIDSSMLELEEGSQVCGLREGDAVTMDALFHSLVIYSANDAAMAIAKHISGSVEEFVALMNQEALSLGATGTHFANPHGLHTEEHYTTVYDIYLMLNEALRYEEFVDTMQQDGYVLSLTRANGTKAQISLDSTDQYLTRQKTPPRGVTVLGGKTGTTDQAGSCLAILAQNSYGEPYVSIVLNAPSKTALYEDMNQLLSRING